MHWLAYTLPLALLAAIASPATAGEAKARLLRMETPEPPPLAQRLAIQPRAGLSPELMALLLAVSSIGLAYLENGRAFKAARAQRPHR